MERVELLDLSSKTSFLKGTSFMFRTCHGRPVSLLTLRSSSRLLAFPKHEESRNDTRKIRHFVSDGGMESQRRTRSSYQVEVPEPLGIDATERNATT
mmetsp:Transcript_48429/g.151886  ORF Transcript_48429/g.151886 Transcript_48429/m.151886 type:complete len:97 (+) Transcript_48429:2916-3206(+)